MRKTNFERYGEENAAKAEKIKDKTKATNLERYGAESPFASDAIKEKIKATNLARYGVESPFHSKEILEKAQAAQHERYGGLMVAARRKLFEKYNGNPFAHPEIQDKIRKTTALKYNRRHFKQTHLTKDIADTLDSKELFLAACSGLTIAESAVMLGVAESTITRVAARHQINDCFATSSRSKWEYLLSRFLIDELKLTEGTDFIRNTKDIIPPLELDFYFPNQNLAIEVGSLFWHSEVNGNRDRHYHKRKWQECRKRDITLLQYWDDELTSSMPVILSKIAHKLNLSKAVKIGGRQVDLRPITVEQEREFLNNYHIQGFTPDRSIVVGAFFKNELIGVVCVAKRKNAFEIVRFATNSKYIIRGLFSKFLKHLSLPGLVFSFSDNRHSDGYLYKSSGFALAKQVDPVYFYTKDYHSKMHRRNFSNAALKKKGIKINKNASEWENMKCLGYDRIWDAGKIRWEKLP